MGIFEASQRNQRNRACLSLAVAPLFATTTALPPLLFSSLTIFLHYYNSPIQNSPYKKKGTAYQLRDL
ncbi:hypothetical protein ACN42_g2421 [Penicillium freii]|uniref:Uncharacterized protein n=1 Tax=Penicillium freii TaxID=48697 RepID=A0A117NQV5_PENFR|nr:hypothetical protein ACN42_g2421 [Penicillium freii]